MNRYLKKQDRKMDL